MPRTFALSGDLPPIPPIDLIYRVVPPFEAENIERERHAFDTEALRSVDGIEFALAAVGRQLADFRRVLDFGCGPGRVMRHLEPLTQTCELHGIDIDAEMIDWCNKNIPFATFVVGPHEPPLPYEPSSFDLIFNHSVFTHLDEYRQDIWLTELQRILTPGGIALLTVHSTRQWNTILDNIAGGGEDTELYRDQLERNGILFISDDHFIGSTHPDWYHSTFHAPWYIHEHWTEFFTLRGYIHEGSDTQDMVILERRPDGEERLRPIGRRDQGATEPPGGTAVAPITTSRSSERSRTRRWLPGSRAVRGGTVQDPAHQLAELRARLDAVPDKRSVEIMRYSLYQQGERVSAIERDLRERMAELESRLEHSDPT